MSCLPSRLARVSADGPAYLSHLALHFARTAVEYPLVRVVLKIAVVVPLCCCIPRSSVLHSAFVRAGVEGGGVTRAQRDLNEFRIRAATVTEVTLVTRVGP